MPIYSQPNSNKNPQINQNAYPSLRKDNLGVNAKPQENDYDPKIKIPMANKHTNQQPIGNGFEFINDE